VPADLRVPYPKALRLFPEVRQSLLASFDNCALTTFFDFKYRHGWSHSYQARGEMFHRFAARALSTMASLGEERIPVGEALEILHEVLRQEDIDRHCPHCGSPRIRKGLTRQGLRLCLACRKHFETEWIVVPEGMVAELYWVVKKWAHDNTFSVSKLVEVETKLRAQVVYPNPHGGSVERTITGTADALMLDGEANEHAIVLDWKDMWRLPPETEIGFGGYFQQRFYAYLIFANFPWVNRVTLREFYVRYSQPREATLWRHEVEGDIRAEIAALLMRFDRTVEESLWVPSPGHHCGFCAAPQHCTIFPEARESGRITNAAEAAQAAAELVVTKAISKQLRGQLEAWCRMHGEVPVRDAKGRRVVGLQPYMRTVTPKPSDIAEAERAKGEPLTADEIARMHRQVPATRLATYVPEPRSESDEDSALIDALKKSVERAQTAA
jgi:hypothetical protein